MINERGSNRLVERARAYNKGLQLTAELMCARCARLI